jgi:hypothetical protein
VSRDNVFRDGAAKDWEKMEGNKIAMAEMEELHGWTEQVQVEGMSLRRHVWHLEDNGDSEDEEARGGV